MRKNLFFNLRTFLKLEAVGSANLEKMFVKVFNGAIHLTGLTFI